MLPLIRKFVLLALSLFASSVLSVASPALLEFALPELEGTISLGIYDQSGKLVRTLAQHASVSSFQIGLNGLVASWDGITNEGKEAPSGKYEVRGFVVGAMKVEGVKFHFNDWVEKNDGPFPTAILSIFCTSKGGLVLLWNALGGDQQLAYYKDFQSLQWVKSIGALSSPPSTPLPPLFAGIHGEEISVLQGNRLSAFSVENGLPIRPFISLPFSPTGACRKGSDFLLAAAGKFSGITVSGAEWPLSPPNQETAEVFATSEGFLALSHDGVVQEWNKGSWHRIPLPFLAKKIAPGYDDTIWATADSPEKEEFLGQFNIQGEFLRKVHLPANETTSCLAAPPDEDKILLLRSRNDGSSYLIGYQFVKTPHSKKTVCQEFLKRNVIPSAHFAFSQSELIPDDPLSPPPALEFFLSNDALNSHPGKTWLQAKIEGDTAWLMTQDGLPLLPVGTLPGASRALIARKTHSETPVLYGGNGAVVAEFSIQGIDHLHPIDAGSIQWK